MEGFNVANVYKYRHCTGAKGCIFHSLFVVASPGFGIRTIVHFRGAICDRLASIEWERERWRRRMRPVGPFDLWNDPTTRGNISFRCTRSVSRETNRQRHRETVTRPLLYGLHTWPTNLLPLWIFRRDFCQSWDTLNTFLDQSWDNGKIERKNESRNNYPFINEIVEEEFRITVLLINYINLDLLVIYYLQITVLK